MFCELIEDVTFEVDNPMVFEPVIYQMESDEDQSISSLDLLTNVSPFLY